jgi:hypothetical protein
MNDSPEVSVSDPLFWPQGCNDIKRLAKHLRCSSTDILAMARKNDPFYAGQDANCKQAEWFARLWHEAAFTTAHLRRIHYRLVSMNPPTLTVDGMPYTNTKLDWEMLLNTSKAARYLGLVPADAIIDARNPDAIVPFSFYDHLTRLPPGVAWDAPQEAWTLPTMPRYDAEFWVPLPRPMVEGYDYSDSAQPVHVEIWIEKSTMDDILEPLAEELSCTLSVAAGYASITRTIDILKRIARAGKPTRILYIADLDPAGQHMAPSVARQLEFWRERFAPGAEVKLDRLILTREQVAYYNLPSNDKGAVELDALEAIVPGELERIVREAVAPYRDPDLASAYAARDRQTRQEVDRAWRTHSTAVRETLNTLRTDVAMVLEEFEAEYEDLRERQAQALAPFRDRLRNLAEATTSAVETFNPDLPACPDPDLTLPEEADWLFDSGRTYLEQMAYYKRQGHLEGEPGHDA